MPGQRIIGNAAIAVTADASGFAQSLQRQGDAAAKGIAGRIGGTIASGLKKSAAVAGVAVGGVLSSAIVKGFQRLSSIDQATQKLTGLGHSGKAVEGIMKNALASVKGTAFGLGDAATIAAGMVAAGIKPGQELERTLKTVADTATIAGSDLGSMGSIFGQVAAKGRLQGEEMLQLSERGVPVLQFLAKHYGVTAQAASDMVSKGKVDFATFQHVMEENLGGAAKNSGKTVVGAWANVSAALSRVGAGLLGGVFKQLPEVFGQLVAWLDKITPSAEKAGATLGRVFGNAWTVIKGLVDLVTKGDYTGGLGRVLGIEEDSAIIGVILNIRDAVVSLLDKVGPALDKLPTGAKIAGVAGGLTLVGGALGSLVGNIPIIGGLVSNLTGMTGAGKLLGPMFQRLAPMIGSLFTSPLGIAALALGGLTAAMMASKDGGAGVEQMLLGIVDQIANFVVSVSQSLPGIIATVVPAIVGAIQAVAKVLPRVLQLLISVIAGLLPLLVQTGVQLFMGLVTALTQILPTLIQAVIGLVTSLVQMLPTLIPALVRGAVLLLQGLIQAVDLIVPAMVDAIVMLVDAIVALLPTLIPTLLQAALSLLDALVAAADKIIPAVIEGVVAIIDAVVVMLPTLIPLLLDAGMKLLMALIAASWRILPLLLDAAVQLINAVVRMLPTLIPMLFQAAVTLFVAIVNSLPTLIPLLIQAAISLIYAVIRLLPTLIPVLFSVAGQLFMAVVKAVPTILGALLGAFGTVLSKAWGFITGTFESWRKSAIEWFGKIGKGISDKWGELTSWLRKPVDTALQWIQVNLIDRFNGLLEKLGISWRIGRIWSGSRQSTAGLKKGGWTGGGPVDKPAGVVHGREWVLNAKSTAALMRDYGVGFLRALNGYAAGGWVSPVVGYKPAFPWGRYPSGGIHKAYDYAVPTGTPVLAPDDGRVAKAGWDSTGYGISVFLDHANGLFSVLGHMRNIVVALGRFVAAGQLLGYSDNTGRSTGPHLHWGVMQGGIYGPGVNPGLVSAAGGIDIKKMLADLVRSISSGAGGGLDWLGEHLGPMGRIVSGIGKKMLGFLTEKALDMLGFGEGGGRVGGPVPFRQYDAGGLLPPGLSMAYNGTGRPEPVGWGYGDITVQMNVSVDDLAKMSQIGDFLKMLDNARIEARRTERSGRVSA